MVDPKSRDQIFRLVGGILHQDREDFSSCRLNSSQIFSKPLAWVRLLVSSIWIIFSFSNKFVLKSFNCRRCCSSCFFSCDQDSWPAEFDSNRCISASKCFTVIDSFWAGIPCSRLRCRSTRLLFSFFRPSIVPPIA